MRFQSLLKYRQPLATVAVVGLALGVVIGFSWFGVNLHQQGGIVDSAVNFHSYFPTAAYLIILLLVISLTLVEPVVPARAWISPLALGLGAAWLLSDLLIAGLMVVYHPEVSTLGQRITDLLLGLWGAIPDAVLVAAMALVVTRSAAPAYPRVMVPVGSELASPQPPAEAVETVARPVWQATEATGGAWQRAGDAATGAGASTTGVPGQPSQGWQVPPRP